MTDPIKYPITIHRDGKSYIAHVELTPELARQIVALAQQPGATIYVNPHGPPSVSNGAGYRVTVIDAAQQPCAAEDEAQDIINRLYNNSGRYGDAARLANIIAALRAQVKELESAVIRLTRERERAVASEREMHEELKDRAKERDEALAKVKELEAKLADRPKVKLPPRPKRLMASSHEMQAERDGYRMALDDCAAAIRAAGIEVES
jgi:hypothetical protein